MAAIVACLGERQHLLRAALVGHFEARRHVGLEREEMQQALAKGVDRLDLEAAGRLDRTGEEAPSEDEIGGARQSRAPVATTAARKSAVVVAASTSGQFREDDACRHLRRRRLREGEAEDFQRARRR